MASHERSAYTSESMKLMIKAEDEVKKQIRDVAHVTSPFGLFYKISSKSTASATPRTRAKPWELRGMHGN